MTGNPKAMSCEEFQAHLAELIGTGADAASHPHVLGCANCRALLADLQTIAEAARQLFPVQQPKDDLWDRIETAIREEQGSSESG
jgi:hypothetical protein